MLSYIVYYRYMRSTIDATLCVCVCVHICGCVVCVHVCVK